MTQKQTEAQRLADELDKHREWLYLKQMHSQSMAEAAALLRRQDELLEQALKALSIVRMHPDSTVLEHNICANAIVAIRAHLEAK